MTMAIYHFTVKIIQRSKGKNAVAAAAYRHASKMYDNKEMREYDYSKKQDVIHSEIILPPKSPAWIEHIIDNDNVHSSSESLWNLIEEIEIRKDAQLAREIEFALPLELSEDQNLELTRAFIKEQLCLRGMVADFSIHWDVDNPHVHILLSTRELSLNGFGKKVTDWNSKDLLKELRMQWSQYANFHLKLHGIDIKIDHRSYEEQGIELIPGVHKGKAVMDMSKRGISTDIMQTAQQIAYKNFEIVSNNPDILLKKIESQHEFFSTDIIKNELEKHIAPERLHTTVKDVLTSINYHESVFTNKDIYKAIKNKGLEGAKELLFQEIMNSSSLIPLGVGQDGLSRYTTKAMFELENDIQKKVDVLFNTRHSKISTSSLNTSLLAHEKSTGTVLSDEQKNAVLHALKPSAISCIIGRAGTGKSFSMAALNRVWKDAGLKVEGVALSGVAADGLLKDANINSRTIASFNANLLNKNIVLTDKHVVVMDEAGMTDSHSMKVVLDAVTKARAKLVLVGDEAQIQPVGPGASFRAIVERIGFAKLETVYRQKEEWQRQATYYLSTGNVLKAFKAYKQHGHVNLLSSEQAAFKQLTQDWLKSYKQSANLSQQLIVAHKNDDVFKLNQLVRHERVLNGEISLGKIAKTKRGAVNIAEGDRIVFLKNDRHLGVKNGRFATLKSVNHDHNGEVSTFTAVLDGSSKEICVNLSKYDDFALGYAATVHKVQGMTVNNVFVYAGGYGWNRNLAYVAMSRHRENCHLYADTTTCKDETGLIRNLAKLGLKDSVLDYPLAFANRRGIDTTSIIKNITKHLATRLDALRCKIQHTIYKDFYQEHAAHKSLNAEPVNNVFIETKSISDLTCNEILASYVDMELKQTKLIQELHIAKASKVPNAKELTNEALLHTDKINRFVGMAMQHPEIIKHIKLLKGHKIPSIATIGGFRGVAERFAKNEYNSSDINVVLNQIRTKSLASSLQQDRSRGGRTH